MSATIQEYMAFRKAKGLEDDEGALVGCRVRLKEFDDGGHLNPPEPEQDGVVLWQDKYDWGEMIGVLIDEKGRSGPEDDGLRECDLEQLKEILEYPGGLQ